MFHPICPFKSIKPLKQIWEFLQLLRSKQSNHSRPEYHSNNSIECNVLVSLSTCSAYLTQVQRRQLLFSSQSRQLSHSIKCFHFLFQLDRIRSSHSKQRIQSIQSTQKNLRHIQFISNDLNKFHVNHFSCVKHLESKQINKSLSEWILQEKIDISNSSNVSRKQKKEMLLKFKLNPKELSYLLWELRNPPKLITKEKIEKIKAWLEKNQYKVPTKEERKELCERIELSRKQLRNQLRLFFNPKGSIDKKTKSKFIEYILTNKLNLQYQTNQANQANQANQYNLIQKNIQNESSKVDESLKEIISFSSYIKLKFYLNQRNIQIKDLQLDENNISDLKTILGWNRFQIFHQFNRLKFITMPLTEYQKQIIKAWVIELQGKTIDLKMKKEFIEKHFQNHNNQNSISIQQLNHYISKYQILNQAQVTDVSKQFIQNWIRNENKIPNTKEKNLLQQLTNLSRQQLNHQIRNITNTKGILTEDKIKLIEYWIKKNGIPEGDSRAKLQQEVRLSSKQLSDIIYNLKNPPGIISKESKEIFYDFMKNNHYNELSTEQMNLLKEKTGWNQRQVRYQINSLFKKLYTLEKDDKQSSKKS